jgi:hypothetical protein
MESRIRRPNIDANARMTCVSRYDPSKMTRDGLTMQDERLGVQSCPSRGNGARGRVRKSAMMVARHLIRMSHRMRAAIFTMLAASVIFAGAMPTHRAEAMSVAATARVSLVQQVVSICGTRGCVPVQTKRIIHHQKPGNVIPHHL